MRPSPVSSRALDCRSRSVCRVDRMHHGHSRAGRGEGHHLRARTSSSLRVHRAPAHVRTRDPDIRCHHPHLRRHAAPNRPSSGPWPIISAAWQNHRGGRWENRTTTVLPPPQPAPPPGPEHGPKAGYRTMTNRTARLMMSRAMLLRCYLSRSIRPTASALRTCRAVPSSSGSCPS